MNTSVKIKETKDVDNKLLLDKKKCGKKSYTHEYFYYWALLASPMQMILYSQDFLY
ncbi:hypothetical protein FACS1894176_04820 [Bacteroidia bacterium]|nr:hypothetical protein FACS1894176_04820 [Bacteroidia bacterium]